MLKPHANKQAIEALRLVNRVISLVQQPVAILGTRDNVLELKTNLRGTVLNSEELAVKTHPEYMALKIERRDCPSNPEMIARYGKVYVLIDGLMRDQPDNMVRTYFTTEAKRRLERVLEDVSYLLKSGKEPERKIDDETGITPVRMNTDLYREMSHVRLLARQ